MNEKKKENYGKFAVNFRKAWKETPWPIKVLLVLSIVLNLVQVGCAIF